MRVLSIFVLWLAACSQAQSVATSSSGGEATMETAATPQETQPETASALSDPPTPSDPEPLADTTPSRESDDAPPTEAVPTETEAPEPVVRARPTTILAPARSGRLRLTAVHDVIREHRPEVTACYQEGLSRDRSLMGVAKVRFLVGPRGRMEDAEVYETSLNDEVVEECILAAMRTWRFPRPRPRGSSVLMTYPYSLATE